MAQRSMARDEEWAAGEADHRWISNQGVAGAVVREVEVVLDVLAEEMEGCRVRAVADGQHAAARVARVAERRGREVDVGEVDAARNPEARDHAVEVLRVVELERAAGTGEVDLAGAGGGAAADVEEAAAQRCAVQRAAVLDVFL